MGTSDIGRPKFEKDTGFYKALKHRVDHFFDETGLRRRDSPYMYLKTALILLWFGASYSLLVFLAREWWQGVLFAASLALAIAGVGFSIQHLFPRISHVHYPRLAPLVEAACAEFGVRYTAYDGLLSSISSHWRWLRKMGRRSE